VNIENPHDSFFKSMLGKKENAIDFLQNYLPEKIIQIIDLNYLEIRKDTFVEKELQAYFSDLLYKTKLKRSNLYLYFLFEHKSYPDKLVAFQLLKYMVRIWEKEIKNNKKLKKMPSIIPYIFYHGKRKWNIGLKLSDVINHEEEIKNYIPNFEYILNDLSQYNDDDIKGNVIIKIMNLIMKHIFDKEPETALRKIFSLFHLIKEQKTGLELLEMVLRYIIHTTEINLKKIKKLVEEEQIEKGGDVVMTTAEKLKQEGRQEGILKGKLETARKMIAKGLNPQLIASVTGLKPGQIQKLRKKKIP